MDAMQFDKAAYVELLRKLISVNKSCAPPKQHRPAATAPLSSPA
jgi:hypothetical protein